VIRNASLILYYLGIAACAGAQTTVEGTIVSTAGAGVASANVQLMSTTLGKNYSVTADARGQFVIEDVKAGTYVFGYFASHYLMAIRLSPPVVQIADGGGPVKLEGHMDPMPRISGRVVDTDGEPVRKARVSLMPGIRVDTDGSGRFELPANPGTFLLSVAAPVDMKGPAPDPDSGRARVWARTFYPGVTLQDTASKITLRVGDVLDVQIKMEAVPAHDVRGVLLNPDGTAAAHVAITLADDLPPAEGRRTQSDSDGAFEFKGVADGEWYVWGGRQDGVAKPRAGAWIDIAGKDIEGLNMALAVPFAVRGRVVTEAPDGTPALQSPLVAVVPHAGSRHTESAPLMTFMLMPPPTGSLQATKAQQRMVGAFLLNQELAISAEPDATGNFTLPDVDAGRYRIAATVPPAPYYLDSIRLGEIDVASAEVEISSGTVPITVVYKTNGGSVTGTVDNCSLGTVLLVPVEPERQSFGFLRSARCNASGRYQIAAVRPGDYYAVPFAGNATSPSLDAALYGPGNRITVRAGETTLADLH
jgi:hypothetical protein